MITNMVLLTVLVLAAAWAQVETLKVLLCLLLATATKMALDVHEMMSPTKFVDLSTKRAQDAFAAAVVQGNAKDWPLEQEVRPIQDAVIHVLLFRWQIFGINSKLFGRILTAMNAGYDCWDIPFEERGKQAEIEVLRYCRRYGIPETPWPWAKRAEDFETMNEWFTRSYRDGFLPDVPKHLRDKIVVAPATAVVTAFPSVKAMPLIVKNDTFSIQGVVPKPHLYEAHPCTLHYLSPADYHCYHAPMSGKIVTLDLRVDDDIPNSVTVKKYVFRYINILKRNRRVVIVIERPDGFRCAMVIIGGITVDSIRLEEGIEEGETIHVGQKVGAFARGGSSIALFFSKPVAFCYPAYGRLAGSGFDCKLACNTVLCNSA